MTKPSGDAPSRGLVIMAIVGAVLGYVGGAIVMVASLGGWSEALKRYLYMLQGGGGEGAYWGEPLFYGLALTVIPHAGNLGGAMVGAAAAVGLARAIASAGGMAAFLRRYAVPLSALWVLTVVLALAFVRVQWNRAREDVARYRGATATRPIVWHSASLDRMSQECEGGRGGACTGLAEAYRLGEGVPQDLGRAVAHYRQGCDKGSLSSCRRLALMYEQGEGVPAAASPALVFYDRACGLGDGWSCFTAGMMHERGQGTSRDFAQAAAFYRRSCDLQYGMGCQYLGDSYAHGEGVPADDARSRALYAESAVLHVKACNGGDAHSCFALGTMHRIGQGVPADAPRAQTLLVRACHLGSQGGCAAAGMSPPTSTAARP